ncbi:2-polyprenyl-6-hydroxyphenyl methylase / 3-demethylubiquinone-9 3-methyltransferase [Erythrobacter litoralis]|jgi:2-polyprenyl-6-hydroxyphenyl methylase/3-demethylubiquinone-9 3-methyltransferase|uniref:Ubiquinone biosynthesis O-methyltransferase n=1 Tax=Erythrobacter litoralis TaxID=39960 RepID=A0A074M8B5_9SPHN|nr:bifunctional 2-polyprenyl-6-hydroxyphenol methylase/3-demethylubiquinol 3-O-methyltransferase UbiG [Erythrobacter litoralis]AOL22341.1 2-polyprenyl-6-hydroxyphenyl methylase / 3-demethylubiquinone-9 3-methyltransferase [Erythrobacter litoralis]KEO89629.1 3-demethylubiquinone-9 3-methyltransferase [Erythrobacter litoralis]MEE4338122.1 bifunctional 2-polyprenyl-6-hydroxyphenol methylase/3-demethylubiquinol 3-O-methyltransferase UbiG [Erythrobacter sp.]
MASSGATTTIRPEEAEHFARLAQRWWDAKGPMASLHEVNPVRLRFIRQSIDSHWPGATGSAKPLAGKAALDIGCGAGLVCEPLARLGADVTGVDAAAENVAAASAHSEAGGLDIRYMAGELAALDIGTFDLVTCLEVIEHVADKRAFLFDVTQRLAPEGLLVLSTPNRTAASRVLLVGAAEAVGYVPRGTHRWSDFVTPEEILDLLEEVGLEVTDRRGIAWSAAKSLHLSDNEALNYILAARRKT